MLIMLVFAGCAGTAERPSPYDTIYYPPLPQQPRLQFLHAISGGEDLGRKQSALQEFLVGKPRHQQLGRPYAVGA